MNSKEALEILIYFVNGTGNKEKNIYYKTIKQDLDRVEQLEKENQELLVNKNVAQGIAINLKEENDKLKKAIDILKDKFDIKISHTIEDIPIIIISLEETGEWYCIDISEEQYNLLKEVIEND